MSVVIDGTSGVTTPGVVNTAGETIATTLSVTGVTTLTGGLNAGAAVAATVIVAPVIVGLVPRTTAPLPVEVVTPVPPEVTASGVVVNTAAGEVKPLVPSRTILILFS